MLQTFKNKIISKIASRHIAGPNICDAINVCRWADRNGYSCILSPWKGDDDSPADMLEYYKMSIDKLNDENINGYLSVKLDALGYDYGIFKELLEYAHMHDMRVHVDSLDPDSATTTYRFLEKASIFNHILGCTLPSRWHRSLTDAEKAIELNLFVRIVKGQWDDPGSQSPDCKKNYLEIANILAGRAKHVGIATHDAALAEGALKCVTATGTRAELEQFFSLPLNGTDIAEKAGCPYRIYVAYGHPGVPYNVKFITTRPSIAAWMVTDFVFNFKKPWVQEECLPDWKL